MVTKKEEKQNDRKDLAIVVDNLTHQLEGGNSEGRVSDSAQAIQELNRDLRDGEGFSEIDFKTELTHNQVVALTRLDSLARLGFLGKDDVEVITRTFQRKLVSLKRKGRGEAIKLHQNIKESEDQRGFWERWFSPQK